MGLFPSSCLLPSLQALLLAPCSTQPRHWQRQSEAPPQGWWDAKVQLTCCLLGPTGSRFHGQISRRVEGPPCSENL